MGCNACPVGETGRYFETRGCEHLSSDKTSHISKYLSSFEICHVLSSDECSYGV